MKKLSFLQNTIVLVLSNLITGSLAFLFSIILSKEIGAQGVGLYHMIMPIYMLFICFTCGGTTVALSKITAEQNSRKNISELYKGITASITFFAFWTVLVSIFIVLFAPFISDNILKDSRTYLPVLIFIPALLFVAMGSILKGYFYGLQNSTFPAVIDIVEKSVRIIILVTLITYFKNWDLKYKVAAAVAAMTAGEFISFVLLYIFYKKSYFSVSDFTGRPDNVFQIIVNVLKISLPLSLNGFLSTALGTLIAIMIPRRLQVAGFSVESSLALYGKLTGMGMNIVMFPSIIVSAISIILVPVISEASSGKSMTAVNRRIKPILRITALIASLSAGLFFSIPNELGKLFYARTDLGNIIFSLSFGVIFMYIESTLFGILNGLGRQSVLLQNTIIMSLIDVTSLYFLVGVPNINIYGYAINFVISPLAGCILNSMEMKRITDVQIDVYDTFVLPVFIAVGEILILNIIKPLIYVIWGNTNISSLILLASGIGSYIFIYFLISLASKKRAK
ncbi:stage V sporulation protein B [Oxobacter pfennigii]|uniref:Stage V sporulation protein B n=1 Tax=Oxobacter pfennigii TaxID=36849 RepID=A0A0N8NT96_9CLOT|nr:stage V sporulation protein B [Oxobacter pfennigii]KPU44216.1 stage V sporulation protein B [Oxobacter pfennigii]